MGSCKLVAALLLVPTVVIGSVVSGEAVWADEVYLGDIVAGGDGRGSAPEENVGINADTGIFELGHNNGNITNTGENPQYVEESTFLDSVFIIEAVTQQINQEGVSFTFGGQDASGNTWNHIISDVTHDIDKGIEDVWAGGMNFWRGAVGIHASAGVTFDLEEIRSEYGPETVRYFQSFAGSDQCGGMRISLHVIASDDFEVLDAVSIGPIGPNQGEFISLEIPEEALYLTLATGAADGGIGCAHGVFAEPVITDTFAPERSVSSPGRVRPCPPAGGGPIEVTISQELGDGDPDETVVINEFITGPISVDMITAEGATVENRVASGLSEQGFIQNWLLLGPLGQAGGPAPGVDTIRLDYLTDGDATELTVEPAPGDQIETDFGASAASNGLLSTPGAPDINPGGLPTWNPWLDPDDTINFDDFYGGNQDNQVMYAFAYVIFEDDLEVDIGLGSDDSVQVLFDSEEIYINDISRGCGGANQVQDIALLSTDFGPVEAGVHTLMLKIFDGGGGNCFRLRFQDSFTGEPITEGIEVCFSPEQAPCEWDPIGVDIVWETTRGALDTGVVYEIDTDDGSFDFGGWIGQRSILGVFDAGVSPCEGPVASLGCSLGDDGVSLRWVNPDQADLEGSIVITVDGVEAGVVPGASTSALISADLISALGSQVCVTNPSGLGACCGVFSGTELYINCGGETLSEAGGNPLGDGRTWLGDSEDNPSPFLLTAEAAAVDYTTLRNPPFQVVDTQFVAPAYVDNAERSALFATIRENNADIVYSVALPPGDYEVTLLFAEGANSQGCEDLEDPALSARYCRVSDLYLNDELVADQFSMHVEAQRALGNELPNSEYGVAVARGPYMLEGVDQITVRVGDLPGGTSFRPNRAAINGIAIRQSGDAPPPPPAELCGNGIDDDRDGAIDCDDGDCSEDAACQVAVGERFVRGDANSDGSINLTDGVIPLLFLFSGGTAPACADAADTNDTGNIEITDAIIIFSWLFTGGAAPAEPSPMSPGYSTEDCGTDASDDGIGCERQAAACE
ncbi:MAG: malectin domain-containing carbohydrate-binding protein [Planctomycetota bacterium]